ncbi:TetR/AcrR family transcriptional regulator, partial [Acinetobacter baumannii]|nr:TetR/AcrR family transcriptional regulator [Acinetobacter baumannii]
MSKSALKILDTAEKLFNENSFVGVGVDLIRDESG